MKEFVIDRPLLGSPFRVEVPSDWHAMELNSERVDFGACKLFQPVAVLGPQYAAVALAVCVRPKFVGGNVVEWLAELCADQAISIKHQAWTTLGASPVAVCLGTQESEIGLMGIYAALFEDGGLAYVLTAMAPDQLWDSVAEVLEQAVRSFRLLDVKGPTMAPPAEWVAQQQGAASAASPPASAPPKKKKRLSVEEQAAQYVPFALADDAESFILLPGMEEIDTSLKPNIVEVDADNKFALISFPAMDGMVNVPFGWKIKDDGDVTQLIDLDNERVVELSWLKEDSNMQAAYEGEVAAVLAEHPEAKCSMVEIEGGPALAIRNVEWKDRPFEQVTIIRDHRRIEGGLTKMCLSAAPQSIANLVELGQIILRDIRLG